VSHTGDMRLTGGRPTSRNGRGKRWKARWTDPEGRERARCFAKRSDAEQVLAMRREEELIRKYRPAWNRYIPRAS
jgi:hypothetical protein